MSRKETPLASASAARAAPGPAGHLAVAVLLRRPEIGGLAVALLVGLALTATTPFFFSWPSVFSMLNRSVIVGTVSIGMFLVVVTGGIDLSVGAVAALTGIVFGLAVQHVPLPLAALLAVVSGAAIGLLSGLVVSAGMAAFAVTLAVGAVARSVALGLSGQDAIGPMPDVLQSIVSTTIVGVPSATIFLLAAYVLAWAYLTHAKGGRTLYAVGSNREAARAAGLRTTLYTVLPYVLSGALAAVASLFTIGQSLSADPFVGGGMELDGIAAALMGGASLRGGRGSVVGTLIGVSILVMIRNGLALVGTPVFWQGLVVGSIILVTLLLGRLFNRQVRS